MAVGGPAGSHPARPARGSASGTTQQPVRAACAIGSDGRRPSQAAHQPAG
jgi:hypothetical protein